MESGASYVNSNSEKFVAFTKTYVKNHSVGSPRGAFIDNNQRFGDEPGWGLQARAAGAPPSGRVT
jgi:hypothetical protein